MDRLIEWYLKKPYLVISAILFFSVIGIIGFIKIPRKFFPDANRPQVAVITVYPGASAEDVASKITRPIEERLKTIDGVRLVRSISKDEVSVVVAEFKYSKGIE